MILFVKLLLAHLIADFLLQPTSWVQAKRRHFIASWQLYLHALLHGVIAFAFVADIAFWPWALALALVHLAIDIAKLYLMRRFPHIDWFFPDQAAHLLSLIAIAMAITKPQLAIVWLDNPKMWLTLTATLLLTYPAAIAINHIMRKWTNEIEESLRLSLKNSGKYIGIFERLLIFTFILYNQWAAIGLLMTAKSVFRFGNLRNENNRKLTEYILLGSFVSLLWAVTVSITYIGALDVVANNR
ncbi:MAG: DUF3307 domain-containing protein [Bacteroidales bacterium]